MHKCTEVEISNNIINGYCELIKEEIIYDIKEDIEFSVKIGL